MLLTTPTFLYTTPYTTVKNRLGKSRTVQNILLLFSCVTMTLFRETAPMTLRFNTGVTYICI